MKITLYILGIISGIILATFFIDSAKEIKINQADNNFSEATKKAELLTKENFRLKYQLEAITRDYALTVSTVDQLQAELIDYKEKREEEEKDSEQRTQSHIQKLIKKYESMLNIDSYQKKQITEYLWERNRDNLSTAETENKIKGILNDEQISIWDDGKNQELNTLAETAASVYLGTYPVSLKLDEGQKDVIWQNLYKHHHPKMKLNNKQINNALRELSEKNEFLNNDSWTTRIMILSAKDVLTEDQLHKLIESYKE